MTDGVHPVRIALMIRRLRGAPDGSPSDEVLGPCERAALTAAIALRGERPATTVVTAIAMGPAQREDRVLAMALRAGCDSAVRVHDEGLDELDYLGVAHVLAATALHVGFDLILCGERSGDERQGAVGPAIAELLEVPHVSSTVTDVRPHDRGLTVTRRADGRIYSLQLALPALVSVARFARPPGDTTTTPGDTTTPSGGATVTSNDEPSSARHRLRAIHAIDLAALGLTARELRYRAQFLGRARPVRAPRQPVLLPDARTLIARLREDHLLE